MKQKLITVQAQTRWEIRHGLTIGFDMNASKQATIIEFIKSLIQQLEITPNEDTMQECRKVGS